VEYPEQWPWGTVAPPDGLAQDTDSLGTVAANHIEADRNQGRFSHGEAAGLKTVVTWMPMPTEAGVLARMEQSGFLAGETGQLPARE
jgi:hypothetical protein